MRVANAPTGGRKDHALTLLTRRYTAALTYTAELHADQRRSSSGEPYLAHLLAVSGLVLEAGGDEDQAIAGLLHDAVEDQGGQPTLEEIRERFGQRVAALVAACTDPDGTDTWRERKELYLARLQSVEPDALLISLADKVHNARAVLRDLRHDGEAVWGRFSGGREGVLWYYRHLAETYLARQLGYLAEELARTVREIERLATHPKSTK